MLDGGRVRALVAGAGAEQAGPAGRIGRLASHPQRADATVEGVVERTHVGFERGAEVG